MWLPLTAFSLLRICFAGATLHEAAFQDGSSQWNSLAKMLEADVESQPYLLQGKLHPYQMQVSLVSKFCLMQWRRMSLPISASVEQAAPMKIHECLVTQHTLGRRLMVVTASRHSRLVPDAGRVADKVALLDPL